MVALVLVGQAALELVGALEVSGVVAAVPALVTVVMGAATV